MVVEFQCQECNQRLSVDSDSVGKTARCPKCSALQQIPHPESSTSPHSEQSPTEIFCPKCGTKNSENNFKCTACEFNLHGSSNPVSVTTGDGTLGGLIPYKNTQGLLAYYMGVFSLIPCVGIPLGITALILGIKGLKYAQAHPEAKGKVHAWIGIILGTLCATVYSAFLVLILIAGIMAH